MEAAMTDTMRRRDFLRSSAALAGAAAAGGFSCVEVARAEPLAVPEVDRLTTRVLIDSTHNIFLRPTEVKGVKLAPAARAADYSRTIHTQWGLSLYLDSQRGNEARAILLDFGYTPEALINNIEIIGVDPGKLDALVVSHGHFDHYGGLIGFLDKHRPLLPADVKLYAGGEDNFCHRLQGTGTPGQLTDSGTLDRRALAARKVATVLCESPTLIAGHAFTTGQIKRRSDERILPNSFEQFGIKDGLGCDAVHYTSAELDGKVIADEHFHEHATCFNVKGRGLVVISSCSHRGIVNAVRQAQEVSGVAKVHAVIGGFHLGPAPPDYTRQIVGELVALDPDVVVPMHCSGQNFVEAMQQIAPDRLLVASAGARLTFGA
jgi:7,8-dihydropterin-6-yl-methyl-4-(beta-D-ribofuranosyl)aminobenzene 5'-phosphate synthase